jgi:hypothetical protein
MPPKKATTAPKKKKDGSLEDGGELDFENQAKYHLSHCNSLQIQLGLKIIF